jgi:hypothetical protein
MFFGGTSLMAGTRGGVCEWVCGCEEERGRTFDGRVVEVKDRRDREGGAGVRVVGEERDREGMVERRSGRLVRIVEISLLIINQSVKFL